MSLVGFRRLRASCLAPFQSREARGFGGSVNYTLWVLTTNPPLRGGKKWHKKNNRATQKNRTGRG